MLDLKNTLLNIQIDIIQEKSNKRQLTRKSVTPGFEGVFTGNQCITTKVLSANT